MQLATESVLGKTSRVISTGVKNTSCNGGWLQLFTHIICGAFTVTSFILILVMTLKAGRMAPNIGESRCQLSGCRIICNEAPYYEEHEDDILFAVMIAEQNCQNVLLTLLNPKFVNESIPKNWLSRVRPVVVELGIVGGNLHHIPHNAFSAAFARNLKIIHLENVTITSWTRHSLLGLASLKDIFIKQCNIIEIQENFLSAVSQTLTTMTVVQSGQWSPENLTGLWQIPSLSMLETVDLSYNDFGAILGKRSFNRLNVCKSLYLGSSRITHIEPGAFDELVMLEYLNLNDNFLKHIELDLFRVMLSSSTPRVRLNLVNNLWHCDCSNFALRQWIRQGTLLVDPICHTPRKANGKTFNEFVAHCISLEPKQILAVDMLHKSKDVDQEEEPSIKRVTCVSITSRNFTPTVVTPFHSYPCSVNIDNYSLSKLPTNVVDFYNVEDNFWVKPIVIFKGDNFTMIELSMSGTEGHGLVWFRQSCLNEIFCVSIVPDTIRLYNIDIFNEYTFCPVVLKSGKVESTQCIAYISPYQTTRVSKRLIFLALVAVGCIFFGALTLYMLIRKYPHLLKGSKRLLFVKHKSVDALVLPPKVPLRSALSNVSLDKSKDWTDASAALSLDFIRSGSMRSCHSITPSYISALHPTEEQLADWRLKLASERFDNHYTTISTISSNQVESLSTQIADHLYFSIEDGSPFVSIMEPFSQNFEYETERKDDVLQFTRQQE